MKIHVTKRTANEFLQSIESHRLTYNVDSPVETVVDSVASYDRIAASSYLNARQSIAVNVVLLDQSVTLSKDVNATLMTIVNFIFPAISSTSTSANFQAQHKFQ